MEHVVELDQEGRVCSADHLFDSQIGQCCPEHKVRYNRDSARNDTVAHVYTDAIAAPNSTCGVWLLLPLPPLLLLLLPLLPPLLSPLLPLLLMGGGHLYSITDCACPPPAHQHTDSRAAG